jgi:PAS domain S-box-containing protein
MAFAAVAADVGLWQFDTANDTFWITEHGRRMLGLGDGPVTRRAMLDIVHPDDRAAVQDFVQSAAQSHSLMDIECRIVRGDGTQRWVRARARADQDPDVPIRISGTFVDITGRKATEVELAERRRESAHLMRISMLGELSGSIAHELTQPLAAILSNAQAARLMMEAKRPDLSEVAAALDDIIGEDHRAGEVIHRMRSLLERGEARIEPVDCNELVRSSVRLLHGELVARHIRCECELSNGLPLTAADPVQLQQVLLNLLLNAIEAMTEVTWSPRVIVVRTTVTDAGEIGIGVTDSGTGLAPGNEDRVFQPYFTTKERGLGLGLAICASIIKSHGGALRLENNETGGATATVRLPRTFADMGG